MSSKKNKSARMRHKIPKDGKSSPFVTVKNPQLSELEEKVRKTLYEDREETAPEVVWLGTSPGSGSSARESR